jgi:hypothetical protein
MTYSGADSVPMDSEKGKAILARAMQEDYCVLEFDTRDDGTTTVADITDHVQQLEEMADAGT